MKLDVWLACHHFKVGVIGDARETYNYNLDRACRTKLNMFLEARAIFLRDVKVLHIRQNAENRNAGFLFYYSEPVSEQSRIAAKLVYNQTSEAFAFGG